ncbi:NACHT domain-containing protein [Micromonospora sp. URMC 103]|uniref:NACHT domain-containing protein n=1 Tax=Micromonospora sp. URMC 103 TaxID=3423406 RepID=UPI003F1D34F2
MPYDYESLLDEHFQQFCQSLLIEEFPDLQCLPVGMPDGGRDAVAGDGGGGKIIFQVKFARNPSKLQEPVAWIADAIGRERSKVLELVKRGATKYIIICNLPMTSHLDVGRYDKVQKYLDEALPIPAQCWWREDLDRRLDPRFYLKLRFPSLLHGPDLLALFWQAINGGEAPQRRDRALRAYLARQFEREKDIRFKQAELAAAPLFDLFVDIPISFDVPDRLRLSPEENSPAVRAYSVKTESMVTEAGREYLGASFDPEKVVVIDNQDGSKLLHIVEADAHDDQFIEVRVGAADLIFDPAMSHLLGPVVIEGAPGQGKSTLTQYLAQVQRAKILGHPILANLPTRHRIAPVAVPIRLELRHFSRWLSGLNPWDAAEERHGKEPNLESAISYHISRFGGIPFDPSDLSAVLSATPTILLLDGLDEVADLDDRSRVIEEIEDATARFSTYAKALQVIVTTRPTALAGSPIVSKDRFTYLSLASIPRPLAFSYAEKWIAIRRLNQDDATELKDILAEKLAAPHMALLAQNTMQLSILLNLIFARGAALPDQRTELYDTYIDIFFARESEKSQTIKKHRKLVLAIHYFLGFYLHCQAQANGRHGAIPLEHLKEVLTEFLEKEGRSTELVDILFKESLERVAALVSRVEGTYEFEVQPLREYFAAKYLYVTRPYSPAGRPRRGTLPDRFDAIAESPYWSNVTRFFAGCFDSGELMGLAERISWLAREGHLRRHPYPRMLALALLQDSVFTQSVRATKDVVESIMGDDGWRLVLPSFARYRSFFDLKSLGLAPDAGADHMTKSAWGRLAPEQIQTERSVRLARIIRENSEELDRKNWWKAEIPAKVEANCLKEWLLIGRDLRILHCLDKAETAELIGLDPSPSTLSSLLDGGSALDTHRFDVRNSLRACLDYPTLFTPLSPIRTPLQEFSALAHGGTWSRLLNQKLFGEIRAYPMQVLRETPGAEHDELRWIERLNMQLRLASTEELADSLSPWNDVISLIETSFGSNRTTLELAVMAAGGTSYRSAGRSRDELLDPAHPLTARLCGARVRAKHSDWWEAQLKGSRSPVDRFLVTLANYAWADPQVIASQVHVIDAIVRSLDLQVAEALTHAAKRSARYSRRARKLLRVPDADLAGLAPATLAFLSHRLPFSPVVVEVATNLPPEGRRPFIATALVEMLLSGLSGKPNRSVGDPEIVSAVAAMHDLGGRADLHTILTSLREVSAVTKPAAHAILANLHSMPDRLIGLAVDFTSRRPLPRPNVQTLARRDGWFDV